MNTIVNYLFETKAMKVAREDQPFRLTSGKLSPFYLNTHFLFGGEDQANALLKIIDDQRVNPVRLIDNIFHATWCQYTINKTYRNVIDQAVNFINENIVLYDVDYISGGERRDWFFSVLIAHLLGKPHIYLFKDLSTVLSWSFKDNLQISDFNYKDLQGANVLHIADLITEASSYTRFWIPAVKSLNANMTHSVSIVDRLQGGNEKLEKEGIKTFSMAHIDNEFFEMAYKLKKINGEQLEQLIRFRANRDKAMMG